jgi:cupin 2 domain-containing protein
VGLDNLFHSTPPGVPGEVTDVLLQHDRVRIERIVSRGDHSPPGFWYDQIEHEWVVLLSGAARLTFGDDRGTVVLGPGDYLHIPPHQRHRVEWTDPDADTVWLAVFYR